MKYLLILFYILSFKKNFSDAWVQKPNSGILINTFQFNTLHQTNSLTGQIMNNLIGNLNYNLYGEYGLNSRITIGGNIFFSSFGNVKNRYFENFKNDNLALNFSEFFARINLYTKNGFASSIVLLFSFPGNYKNHFIYSNEFSPKTFDYEFRVEFGYSPDQFKFLQLYNAKKIFFTTHFGYRTKINYQFNEIRFNFTTGIPLFYDQFLLIKFNKINYIKKFEYNQNNLYGISFLNINGTKLSYASISISLLEKISNQYLLEIGYNQTIHNNFFKTNLKPIEMVGGFIGLWYYF